MVNNPELFTGNNLDLSLEIQPLENPEGELHLRFYLASGEEFALSAMSVSEVLHQSPDDIAPIPNASPLLLGTINLRGKIIWVADLGQFLGDNGILNTDRPNIPIIAIEHQEQVLGLAIERIGGIDWLDIEQMKIYRNPSERMAPFIQGQWLLDEEQDRVLNLLEPSKILRSARWGS
jgi:purine-binding chemotaxis protein CheW